MAISPKGFSALLFAFLASLTLMGCKPETPPQRTSQTGALVSPRATATPPSSPLPTPVVTSGPSLTPYPTPWPPDFTPSRMPTPTPTPAGVSYIITDTVNHFSATVLPGWYASIPDAMAVGGVTSISNYNQRLVDEPPPGSVRIDITVSELDAGQSFEQWLSNQRALETNPDLGGGGITLTEPQPYTLSRYTGVTYIGHDSFSNDAVVIIYLLTSDRRIVGIGVRPVGALALSDVLSMLSTLEVSPQPLP
jgi:hypothetical protein